MRPRQMREQEARSRGDDDRSAEAFPRFAGADAWNHLVLADERPHRIRAGVAELCHEDKVEDVELSVIPQPGKKINLLHEVEQPRHIHQPEERRRNGEDALGVALGEELQKAKPEHKQDEEDHLEVIHPRWRAVQSGEPAFQVQERSHDQHRAGKDAPALEADHAFLLNQAVELDQAHHPEQRQHRHEHDIRDEPVAGEQRAQHDSPEDQRAGETAHENLRLRGRRDGNGSGCGFRHGPRR